jgi:hypothetical protein
MSDVVNDAVAEKLEASGLWRRAAARWLDVMQSPVLTDPQRFWIRQRRAYCQSQITPLVVPERLDINEIARAASETQKRMGIAQPNGSMFRAFPPQGRNKNKA